MKKLMKILLAAVPLVLAGNVAVKAADEFVRIASGPSGGSWYPLGAKMAEIFGKIEGLSVSNGPGGGVGNVLDVNKKEAELGWTYGHTSYDGFKGNAPTFKSANPNIRHLATFYPAGLQTVVKKDSDIKSYSDLKTKNLIAMHALIVSVIFIDQLPNASWNMWTWFLTGALVGRTIGLREEAVKTRAARATAPASF